MDYLAFDALALALPAGLLMLRRSRRRFPHAAAAGLILLALAWTAPWDDYLVRTGVWSYAPAGVLARVAAVPAEEYLFVVLQVVLVAAWGLHVPARTGPAAGLRRRGAVGWAVVGLLGLVLLATGGHARYAGLLLAWASAPLALQHAVAGDVLGRQRARRVAIALPVVVWLCIADRLALAHGIWTISPSSSSGMGLLGLPYEEAAFFGLTCLLVTDGLLLGTDPLVLARVRLLLRHAVRRAGAAAGDARPAAARARAVVALQPNVGTGRPVGQHDRQPSGAVLRPRPVERAP